MKIIHCCLSSFYIDGYTYQENELVREHINSGHEVLVIASTESFDKKQKKIYSEPSEYIGSEGAKVIRLPFSKWLPTAIMKKVKSYQGLYALLERFSPDVIMFHGLSALELLTVCRFKRKHPKILFYADNHADANNSAKNFVSKLILHHFFYRKVIQNCLPQIEKVLCISVESMKFCSNVYRVPESCLEFYPLGGHVFSDREYYERRVRLRENFNLNADAVLFVQTGKFDEKKRLVDSLRAFSSIYNQNFRFFIAGSLSEDIKEQVAPIIASDNRVHFLGWKNSDFLKDLLCAADVYVQPGSQSATMQMSLCARCPVILDDVVSHEVFVKGNGWLVYDKSGLQEAIEEINSAPEKLNLMSQKSLEISQKLLDYKHLSKRILK